MQKERNQNHLMGTRDVAQWIEHSFSVHDSQHFVDSGVAMCVSNPSMQKAGK